MNTIIHVGDVGTAFELVIEDKKGVPVNVSTATSMVMYFQKPDKSKISRTPVFSTDGLDGKIQYVSAEGDIDIVGEWIYQGYVIFSEAEKFFSLPATFDVHRNIKPTV